MSQTRTRSWLITVWLALLCSCAHVGSRELLSPNPHVKEIRTGLDKIVFAQVSFRDVDVRDVLNFISDEARSASGDHAGVSMMIHGRATVPTITINMRNATFCQVLDEACRQADLVWRIEPQCVLITPRSEGRRVR